MDIGQQENIGIGGQYVGANISDIMSPERSLSFLG
jgi:hypothetical protein